MNRPIPIDRLNVPSFWSKVDRSGECWLWMHRVNNMGYGVFSLAGHETLAHRISWVLANGPMPSGLELLHNCPGGDNPRCINPAHLHLGTHAENLADAARKGRMPSGDRNPSRLHPERLPRGTSHPARIDPSYMARGERLPHAKLTAQDVREIRARVAAGELQREVAAAFGICQTNVSNIVRRKSWKHVP